jgi:hypothetical protein
MLKQLWRVGVGWASLLGAACKSSEAPPPPLAPCTAASGGQISLAVGVYTAIDPTQTAGCAVFQANAGGSLIQYLAVPQAATSTADDSQAFKLGGNPLAAPPAPVASLAPAIGPTTAQQFDFRLRLAERELAVRVPVALRAPPRVPTAVTPVTPGSQRTFKVCNVLTCDPRDASTFSNVMATALSVGVHIAIFVDDAAPQPGMTQPGLDSLRSVFDTRLYATDTLAFGRESDIDNNGMVIVLMTNKVNSMVTASQCHTGFVAGYFFGADLITTAPFATGNNGEIFYSIVPDPSGTLSCPHAVSEVTQQVPVTFVHEFQHMISFNQHFLVRHSLPEDLWLNEGLSHYAEENGGRTYLTSVPPDTATFCNYVIEDIYRAGQYFGAPQKNALVDTAGIGGLANRGAYWLLVRYLVDQLGPTLGSSDSVTRRLDRTSITGAANVSNVAGGTPFETILERWALANYVSDLSSFTVPPELQYTTWRFRTDFSKMQSACRSSTPSVFPLDTVTHSFTGSALAASGVLHAGSGSYYLLQQAAGAPKFTLLFSDSAGAALRATLVPRLNVIRIQ